AAAAERPEVALEQEGVARPVPPREAFAWIDTLRQLQPATVARVEAAIGASLHRIERNDSMAVYEASGSARPWVRRVELRLPERANQGWSFFLILDLDPTLVELLPSDAMAYRAGARAGANPVIPPGWRDIFKYWELAAPDFLLWDNGDETILLRFRSQGPRRLQQCSLYRKSPPPAAGIREGHRALRLGNRKVETGLGSAVDALVNDSSTTAAQVQALQDAGWRMLWSPLAISAVDFVQKAILLPKDKNPQKSYAWLLWELGRIPRPLDAVAAARPA
ncbi:hypothetical protein, partial [Methylacidimicrobium cyclopophantes]|uniref:hypothetical protein n=1 Tax=Methylacidimicrobium cyclopophantes TaxID=1041766 RepID=UPI0015B707ED